MIPLQSISQVRFTIKGDTLVGYTFNENRRIAILLQEGDYYKSTNTVNETILKSKDNIITTLKYQNQFSDSLIIRQNRRLNELLILADKNTNQLNKLSKNVKFWRTTTLISLAICVPIILLK